MTGELEPTPRSPETPVDLEELRHRWVGTDLAARALSLDEGTVLAWSGQKKIKSKVRSDRWLVWFDDVESLIRRLPIPKNRWEQDDLIAKQARQVKAATSRLTNLLTDTSTAELFHQLPVHRGDVISIDGSLWHLAVTIEAFRKRLNGSYYERGFRITTETPKEEE